ncbi:MAG TPA: aspartate aminotransferase family protein [Clostridia bacterium]|nr:aspartate aminotransferase family protein [Clostridia bacterium]
MINNNSIELFKEYKDYLFPATDFLPRIIDRSEGSYVYDVDGNKILDLNAGQFCSILGHNNEGLKKIINLQMDKIYHTSTAVISPEVLIAAKKVSDICYGLKGKVLFLSTGSEAVECALRYAKHITKKDGVICFDRAYHGLSLGSQSVTYGGIWSLPRISNVYSVTTPDLHEKSGDYEKIIETYVNEVSQIVSKFSNEIAAFIAEPIVSVGGMIFPPKEYFKQVYEICKKNNIIFIFDESQTGFGRTGKWFGYQSFDFTPDIIVGSKGMGLGYPVSMVLFNDEILMNTKISISHFSSHQNDPLAAALVSYVIDYINENNLLNRVTQYGQKLLTKLINLSEKCTLIKNPRGLGLMIGFDVYKDGWSEYKEKSKDLITRLLDYGIMLQSSNQFKTYRLLPNYLITDEEIDYFINGLEKALREME